MLPAAQRAPKMHLCSLWMCVLVFERPLQLPFDGAHVEGHPDLAWVANNSSKPMCGADGGGAAYEAWSLTSTRQFGTQHKCPQEAIPEAKRAEVTALMLRAFEECTGLGVGSLQPLHVHVQLWGAAVPLNVVGSGGGGGGGGEARAPCALDVGSGVGVCGDWFSSPSVEGAAESGLVRRRAGRSRRRTLVCVAWSGWLRQLIASRWSAASGPRAFVAVFIDGGGTPSPGGATSVRRF
jgi:predicted NAD/FAD-dependent oxidoreductase